MKTHWIGIDVGGANLKASDALGWTAAVSFPLWKSPERLSQAIESLIEPVGTARHVALTMTGELADCYQDRAVGVRHIVESVAKAIGTDDSDVVLKVYSLDGQWLEASVAVANPDCVAAANWHAQASFATRLLEPGCRGLLIDVGSTTTDLIPIDDQRVLTSSRTDTDRLIRGELLYFGAQRTPLCAVLSQWDYRGTSVPVMSEWFATTDDCGIVLGAIDADPEDCNSADGKPRDVPHSVNRLARMIGLDHRQFTLADARRASLQVRDTLQQRIALAARSLAPEADVWIVSGHGQWLVPPAPAQTIRLDARWGQPFARVGPAYALAAMAQERFPEVIASIRKPSVPLPDTASEGAVVASLETSACVRSNDGTGQRSRSSLRVVKVGGSLLRQASVALALRDWLADQPPCKTAVVLGGGELVDVIRDWDRRFSLDRQQVHWMCVDLLRQTWSLASMLLPDWIAVGDPSAWRQWRDDPRITGPALVAIDCFYRPSGDLDAAANTGADPALPSLPNDWSTTSDSIAALLAQQLQADELVLLKSCDKPDSITWDQAAQAGIVDEVFPQMVRGIGRVRVVNMKAAGET